MKKIAFAFLALLFSAAVLVPRTSTAQENKAKWPEMKEFHGVMSGTFHPSEDGNLEPIKTRSAEMLKKAELWLKSTPPKEFDKPNVKETLTLLVEECKQMDALVQKKASDEELKKALFNLHERFHSVVGACNAGDEKHSDGEKH